MKQNCIPLLHVVLISVSSYTELPCRLKMTLATHVELACGIKGEAKVSLV